MSVVQRTPSYRKHRASGQAIVAIGGRMHYLGPWGSQPGKSEYDRLIAEWLACRRQAPANATTDVSVAELALRYWKHAHRLLAHGAEFRADVQIGFLLFPGGGIKPFGVQFRCAEAVDAGENRLLVLVAGLHAGGFQMLKDEVFKRRQFSDILAMPRQFFRRNRLIALQRLDRERPAGQSIRSGRELTKFSTPAQVSWKNSIEGATPWRVMFFS